MRQSTALFLTGLALWAGPALVWSQESPPSEAPAVSQERVTPLSPAAQPKLPDHYRVWIWQENGDCLWRIAEKVYGDRTKWNLIYMANRDVIKDPNKIYPKQRLRIPPPDWQP